jgi:antitoxin component YwqK of YwqJK toxin-antitoxin module
MIKVKLSNLIIAFLCLSILISCGQTDVYNLKNYKEIKKGAIALDGVFWPNVRILQNKKDTNYSAKIIYEDSVFRTPQTILFLYKNTLNGPYYLFVDGHLYMKGHYTNGKQDGERLTYRKGNICNKAYFMNGIKSGTWEEYNEKGKLLSKSVFDEKGNLIENVAYKD